MIRVMFDTNIYDEVNCDAEFRIKWNEAVEHKKAILITTHIQEDELNEGGVPRVSNAEMIPTAGAVWGQSIWGKCKWGDGSQSGISIYDVTTKAGNCIKDALIAVTAAEQADYFVTDDKRLYNKLKKLPIKCAIVSSDEFKKILFKI